MFLQIGDLAIAINHIESIILDRDLKQVTIYTVSSFEEELCVLEGDDYGAFMDWWENKAEVYKAL